MNGPDWDVIVVGAGLSGLSAALTLHMAGQSVCVFEASNQVGGRIKTEVMEGFLLDHGFQVLLTAYPEAQKQLDFEALELQSFMSGAEVVTSIGQYLLADPFRHPETGLKTALAPVGTLTDKWLVAQLRMNVLRMTPEAIFSPNAPHAEQRAGEFLTDFGFSDAFLAQFFKPFFSGVFLENELSTPAAMLLYTYRMFSQGQAALPKAGMQAIPHQLAAQLPPGHMRLNTRVMSVSPQSVILEDGSSHHARQVVMATDAKSTELLLGQAVNSGSKHTTTLYFSAPSPPVERPILVLNGTGRGRIHHWCVPSLVQPSYAPQGQHLISVSVNGLMTDEEIPTLLRELETLVGKPTLATWRHLKSVLVCHALPCVDSIQADGDIRYHEGILLCGDYMGTPSIQGALVSGRKAAEAVLENMPVQTI